MLVIQLFDFMLWVILYLVSSFEFFFHLPLPSFFLLDLFFQVPDDTTDNGKVFYIIADTEAIAGILRIFCFRFGFILGIIEEIIILIEIIHLAHLLSWLIGASELKHAFLN